LFEAATGETKRVAKLLLVEDDLAFAKELISWLESERHSVDHLDKLAQVRDYLRSYVYDILILDWELPDGSGVAVCKRLFDEGLQTPIVMLTGRTETLDRIAGLDSGAVDYVCKPCVPEEISARIRAILRRQDDSAEIICCGDTKIDFVARTIEIGDSNLKLSPTEFEILFVLASRAGTILSPQNIIDRCGSYSSKLARSSLRVHLANIRKKYAELGAACPIEWRDYGYIFSIE
jgi:two-component system, OmpR family, response regulator